MRVPGALCALCRSFNTVGWNLNRLPLISRTVVPYRRPLCDRNQPLVNSSLTVTSLCRPRPPTRPPLGSQHPRPPPPIVPSLGGTLRVLQYSCSRGPGGSVGGVAVYSGSCMSIVTSICLNYDADDTLNHHYWYLRCRVAKALGYA